MKLKLIDLMGEEPSKTCIQVTCGKENLNKQWYNMFWYFVMYGPLNAELGYIKVGRKKKKKKRVNGRPHSCIHYPWKLSSIRWTKQSFNIFLSPLIGPMGPPCSHTGGPITISSSHFLPKCLNHHSFGMISESNSSNKSRGN